MLSTTSPKKQIPSNEVAWRRFSTAKPNFIKYVSDEAVENRRHTLKE